MVEVNLREKENYKLASNILGGAGVDGLRAAAQFAENNQDILTEGIEFNKVCSRLVYSKNDMITMKYLVHLILFPFEYLRNFISLDYLCFSYIITFIFLLLVYEKYLREYRKNSLVVFICKPLMLFSFTAICALEAKRQKINVNFLVFGMQALLSFLLPFLSNLLILLVDVLRTFLVRMKREFKPLLEGEIQMASGIFYSGIISPIIVWALFRKIIPECTVFFSGPGKNDLRYLELAYKSLILECLAYALFLFLELMAGKAERKGRNTFDRGLAVGKIRSQLILCSIFYFCTVSILFFIAYEYSSWDALFHTSLWLDIRCDVDGLSNIFRSPLGVIQKLFRKCAENVIRAARNFLKCLF